MCGTCDSLKLQYIYSVHNGLSSRSSWIDKYTKCASSSGLVSCNQTLVESLATRSFLPLDFDFLWYAHYKSRRPKNAAIHTSVTKRGLRALSSVNHKRVPIEEQFLKLASMVYK